MFKCTLVMAAIITIITPLAAQVTETKDPKEKAEDLRKEAVAFLHETMGEVANMRTLENRISFTAEMAGLMWYYDEREARAMFNSAIADFRELLARLDYQLNELPDYEHVPRGGLFADASSRLRLEMKYRIAMGVRQQIAMSIAEHDPEVALGFYYDTASASPKGQENSMRDANFESSLIGQIAERDPAKALQFGVKSLDKGFNYQHIELLRRIYAKDSEKGIEFGGRILEKIRMPADKGSAGDFAVRELLSYGINALDQAKRSPGRPAVFTEAQLREVIDNYSAFMLRPSERFDPSTALSFASTVEKISPSRAMQLRSRYGSSPGGSTMAGTPPPPMPPRPRQNTPRPPGETGGSGLGNAQTDPGQSSEEKLEKDVKDIGSGALSKEDRERVVGQARKVLNQAPGRDKQIVGLSMLAAQVAKAGDKDLAADIMRDAERLVNPAPKNYQDFLFTWMLVGGYAETDPDRAFPILDDAIARLNNVISAAVQVGEFVDASEEMISDGEVQLGGFGGGMIRGLSTELGVAEATIGRLARADFARTKALTNRFERPEVRVLAKMLVLRTILGKKAARQDPAAEKDVVK